MYSASELFKQHSASTDRLLEIKALVNGIEYDKTKVIDFAIEESTVPQDDFAIGSVISNMLTISIKTLDIIPSNAKIEPYCRFYDLDNNYTEWLPLGKYYIDTRSFSNSIWKFSCYDKLILTNQSYVTALEYPATMQAIFEEIAGQLGLELDASIIINAAYTIDYINEDITLHDMLGYIASTHGCSVYINKVGKLAFVDYSLNMQDAVLNVYEYMKCEQINPTKTITKIVLTYNEDGETLEAGTGSVYNTLNIYNPYMTEAMLTTLYNKLNGFTYTPVALEWRGRPYLDIGDRITIPLRDNATVNALALLNTMSFKGGLKVSTKAPAYSEQKSEFDYAGSLIKQVKRINATAVKQDNPYYGVTIGRTNGLKVVRSDGLNTAIFNSDKIEIKKGDQVVFQADADGNLIITGIVNMQTGSVISWDNLSPEAQVNLQGPPGADGAQGPTGPEPSTERLTTITKNLIQTGTVLADTISTYGQYLLAPYVVVHDTFIDFYDANNDLVFSIGTNMVGAEAGKPQLFFSNGCSVDTFEGSLRLRTSATNYIRINAAGGVDYVNGDSSMSLSGGNIVPVFG